MSKEDQRLSMEQLEDLCLDCTDHLLGKDVDCDKCPKQNLQKRLQKKD